MRKEFFLFGYSSSVVVGFFRCLNLQSYDREAMTYTLWHFIPYLIYCCELAFNWLQSIPLIFKRLSKVIAHCSAQCNTLDEEVTGPCNETDGSARFLGVEWDNSLKDVFGSHETHLSTQELSNNISSPATASALDVDAAICRTLIMCFS